MSGRSFQTVRALVCDSTRHASELLASMLRVVGFRHITVAGSASVFAEHIGRGSFGIAFVGDQPDALSGAELVRGIRATEALKDRYTPIVMMFSDSTQRSIVLARDAGVTDFIRKPVSPAILATRIEQVLSRPRPVVTSPTYVGPDRRRRDAMFKGDDRRGR
jgi:DNA-binding response OmpR family regulator